MNDNLPPLMSPLNRMPEPLKLEVQAYARAAIEKDRAEHQSVPTGYVRVPIEPTDEMLGAFFNACPMLGGGDDWEAATEGARQEVAREWAAPWAAMIAAAPRPQPVQQEPVGWIDAKALEELRLPEMTWMPIWNRQSGNRPVALYTSPLAAAAPQPQPVQEPVAYLDIGAGGYLDIATNLTDEQLLALPKGRHALVIAGTFGIDGYTSPQAQPTRPLTETQADALNTLFKMLHSGEEVEGYDGLAMLVPMDLWNEAQEAIELLIGEDDCTEAAHGITKGTT